MSGLDEEAVYAIEALLSYMTYLPLDTAIEDQTILIRRQHKTKLPDAIIAATALVNGLQLITLDKKLVRTYEQCQ